MRLIAKHSIVFSSGEIIYRGESNRNGEPVFQLVIHEVNRGEMFDLPDHDAERLVTDGAAFRSYDPSISNILEGFGR